MRRVHVNADDFARQYKMKNHVNSQSKFHSVARVEISKGNGQNLSWEMSGIRQKKGARRLKTSQYEQFRVQQISPKRGLPKLSSTTVEVTFSIFC